LLTPLAPCHLARSTTAVGTSAVPNAGLGPWPGAGTSGELNSPHGVAYDANTDSLFISDTANCEVLEESLASKTVQVIVNLAHVCGPPSAPPVSAGNAVIGPPHGLTVDETHNLLYIADPDNHGIDVVNLSTMNMEPFIQLTPAAPICSPEGVGVDQSTGTLYVADLGCDVVWQIAYFEGPPAIVAGIITSPGFSGNGGPATAAQLDEPSGVAYDSTTSTLYIADGLNNEVRDVVGAKTYDYVGDPLGTSGCSPDGSVVTSPINDPHTVRLDGNGDLFYAETGNNLVREVVPGPGPLTTIAGTP
jgi:DNA-binding beta-propeller fold protein YncE